MRRRRIYAISRGSDERLVMRRLDRRPCPSWRPDRLWAPQRVDARVKRAQDERGEPRILSTRNVKRAHDETGEPRILSTRSVKRAHDETGEPRNDSAGNGAENPTAAPPK
jgi:hypothetical protein